MNALASGLHPTIRCRAAAPPGQPPATPTDGSAAGMTSDQPPLAAETIAQLIRVNTAEIPSQLTRRGSRRTVIGTVRPLRGHNRMVGTALSLRYVPTRGGL